MSEELKPSQATIASAVPVLGGGTAVTAVSSTFEGTGATVALVVGVMLILLGAVLLGKGLQQKKLEES